VVSPSAGDPDTDVFGIVFGLGRHLDAPTAGHELEFLGAVRVPEANPAGGGPVPGPTAGTAGHLELYNRSMQEVRRFTPSTVPSPVLDDRPGPPGAWP
jgi:hypothetical protein